MLTHDELLTSYGVAAVLVSIGAYGVYGLTKSVRAGQKERTISLILGIAALWSLAAGLIYHTDHPTYGLAPFLIPNIIFYLYQLIRKDNPFK